MAGNYLDEETITAIFEEFVRALYKYALRLCHDSRVSDRIVGDAFAQLVEQFAISERHRSDPRLYLYQAAYRSIVEYLRERHDPSADALLSASNGSKPQDDQDALIVALKDELTENQLHVIILYYLEDFNVKETAEILDKNVGEIRASLKELRKIIDNQPDLLTDALAALLYKKKRRRKPK